MVRRSIDRILLIGDTQRQVEAAVAQAVPSMEITHADNYFDGLAELSNQKFGAVVANAEPIERRPEAAMRALREAARESRVILFGHPTLEPVSRKMMEFGCDDYVIAPPQPGELSKLLAAPVMRLALPEADDSRHGETASVAPLLDSVSLPDIMLDAMVAHPGAAIAAAVAAVNDLIGPQFKLSYSPQQLTDAISTTVHADGEVHGHLSLAITDADDEYSARQFLERAVHIFSKLATLEDRHAKLTKLATTDQLTGVANRRFFEHFLAKLLEKAKVKRFPVSLFLFDIDNFKKYNDEYGHAVGDEILKETAALMRRCCRKHDLVARIGGDEFAVVFWEKEGPRQPKEGVATDVPPTRAEEPVQVLRRFQKMIASSEWAGLGPSGRGTLTISGGLANYPWDGRSVEELNAAADKALTFGAKKSGKNSIHLVGGESQSLE